MQLPQIGPATAQHYTFEIALNTQFYSEECTEVLDTTAFTCYSVDRTKQTEL